MHLCALSLELHLFIFKYSLNQNSKNIKINCPIIEECEVSRHYCISSGVKRLEPMRPVPYMPSMASTGSPLLPPLLLLLLVVMELASTDEHHCGGMIRAQTYFLYPSFLTTLYEFHLSPIHATCLSISPSFSSSLLICES